MAVAEELRSIVAVLADIDAASMSGDELACSVVAAEALLNAAHSLSAVVLDEFDRRGAWADEGALSAAGWVAGRTGTSPRVVRARERAGAGLRLLPGVGSAARAGRLSPHHVNALAICARRHPDLAARDEAILVEEAEALDADAFGLVARRWAERAEAVDGPDRATLATPAKLDELHLSRTFDGRYQLDGNFSTETGEIVAALDAEVDRQLRAARDGDPAVALVASRVRAAALVDLVAQTMRREPSDASTPDRYRVAVVVRADRSGELPMAACDSPAFRVMLSADSEVLDVGRLTQAWPVGIRRAITLRDGSCVFPDCGRPPSWCDIHHCRPWNDGGSTVFANGALLCRRHHTFIHKEGWTIAIEGGKPTIRKPDGSLFVVARWNTAA
jgi:hypothetical protein